MSEPRQVDSYLGKATESLAGAESEFAAGRYNNCANRAYYACLQAATAALLREDIRAARGQWEHRFVQSRFAAEVVNRRHRYPASPRSVLADMLTLRQSADYDPEPTSRAEANRSLRLSGQFVNAIEPRGGARP